jgi:hypothetical protein
VIETKFKNCDRLQLNHNDSITIHQLEVEPLFSGVRVLIGRQEYYFAASDLQMEAFVSRSSFVRAVLLHVLFHGDLVVPDVLLYISNHLYDVIGSGEPISRFIATGIRNGAILPAFRNGTNTTFTDNLAEIRAQGIQGLHPGADKIRDFFEAAIRGKRLNFRTWPKEPLSVGYLRTLERVLLSEPTTSTAAFEEMWTRSRALRQEVLGNTRRDDMGGIRRGDLMNATHLHVNKATDAVDDIRMIWNDLRDSALVDDVKKFLKWCNYAYQYNQGKMFNLGPSLTSMDDLDVEFSNHLTACAAKDETGSLWQDHFVIPSEEALLTVDPSYLFDVRDGVTGTDYFEAVEAWQRKPSDDSVNIFLDRLGAYSREINRLYIAKGRNVLNWEWHIKAHIPEDKIWNRTGVALARDTIGGLIPHFGLLSLVGPLGAATYEWLPAAVARQLGIHNRVRIEVNPNVKRLRPESDQMTDASFTG